MSTTIQSLDELVSHNDRRFAAFCDRPFFSMVRDGSLHDRQRREVFLACLQRFSRSFQSLLHIRQGLCIDPAYARSFLEHLEEETGHDRLLAGRANAREVEDTLFEAIIAWFAYQMLVLDNVDRAALMHLVLERAGDHFHSLAHEQLAQFLPKEYFSTHAELDEGHAAIGVKLLEAEAPKTYGRIAGVLDGGWDMMLAMTDRIVCLVGYSPTFASSSATDA